jgi:ribosomal-protein-alanine N-acetyltransferase
VNSIDIQPEAKTDRIYSAPYSLTWVDDLPMIRTRRLLLIVSLTDHLDRIVRYLQANREHLKPWEPSRSEAYFTREAWAGAPERDQQEARSGTAYRFRILALQPNLHQTLEGDYLGTVSLRNILGWPNRNATIGYSLDHLIEGKGIMSESVAAVVRFAFEHVGLKRVEACYMPSNVRSAKLLERLGFQVEGLLRRSLEVDGVWEDHHICALINEELK